MVGLPRLTARQRTRIVHPNVLIDLARNGDLSSSSGGLTSSDEEHSPKPKKKKKSLSIVASSDKEDSEPSFHILVEPRKSGLIPFLKPKIPVLQVQNTQLSPEPPSDTQKHESIVLSSTPLNAKSANHPAKDVFDSPACNTTEIYASPINSRHKSKSNRRSTSLTQLTASSNHHLAKFKRNKSVHDLANSHKPINTDEFTKRLTCLEKRVKKITMKRRKSTMTARMFSQMALQRHSSQNNFHALNMSAVDVKMKKTDDANVTKVINTEHDENLMSAKLQNDKTTIDSALVANNNLLQEIGNLQGQTPPKTLNLAIEDKNILPSLSKATQNKIENKENSVLKILQPAKSKRSLVFETPPLNLCLRNVRKSSNIPVSLLRNSPGFISNHSRLVNLENKRKVSAVSNSRNSVEDILEPPVDFLDSMENRRRSGRQHKSLSENVVKVNNALTQRLEDEINLVEMITEDNVRDINQNESQNSKTQLKENANEEENAPSDDLKSKANDKVANKSTTSNKSYLDSKRRDTIGLLQDLLNKAENGLITKDERATLNFLNYQPERRIHSSKDGLNLTQTLGERNENGDRVFLAPPKPAPRKLRTKLDHKVQHIEADMQVAHEMAHAAEFENKEEDVIETTQNMQNETNEAQQQQVDAEETHDLQVETNITTLSSKSNVAVSKKKSKKIPASKDSLSDSKSLELNENSVITPITSQEEPVQVSHLEQAETMEGTIAVIPDVIPLSDKIVQKPNKKDMKANDVCMSSTTNKKKNIEGRSKKERKGGQNNAGTLLSPKKKAKTSKKQGNNFEYIYKPIILGEREVVGTSRFGRTLKSINYINLILKEDLKRRNQQKNKNTRGRNTKIEEQKAEEESSAETVKKSRRDRQTKRRISDVVPPAPEQIINSDVTAVIKKRRGRPPKTQKLDVLPPATEQVISSAETNIVKKRRGRPPKKQISHDVVPCESDQLNNNNMDAVDADYQRTNAMEAPAPSGSPQPSTSQIASVPTDRIESGIPKPPELLDAKEYRMAVDNDIYQHSYGIDSKSKLNTSIIRVKPGMKLTNYQNTFDLLEGLVMRGTGTITYQNRTGQLQPLSPFFITPNSSFVLKNDSAVHPLEVFLVTAHCGELVEEAFESLKG